MGFFERLADGAFYGSRAKLVEKVEGPIVRSTPFSRDSLRRVFGAAFLLLAVRRVFRALRAALKK